MSRQHFQIAVLGSGFAGSLMAMIAQRLGFSTVLVERGRHPRFVIGESSTPLANLLLEELADKYDLPFVRPLAKWGTWQEKLPRVAGGIKRGFTFYHHELGKRFTPDPALGNQLLVGASVNEATADTHWYRPDFDQYLVQCAQRIGVTYFDETNLTSVREESVRIDLDGDRQFSADFVVDATGPRGFLHRSLKLPEQKFPLLPRTQALFSHFTGVVEAPKEFVPEGQTPPYPPEQAAVHHIFSDGWIWVLKFNSGITSAGVAATDSFAQDLDFQTGEMAWRKLLAGLPSVEQMFAKATPVVPFIHQPRVSFRSSIIRGPRWALLPSAAGVIDPLLSTGFPLTLLGISRLAEALSGSSLEADLDRYAAITARELDTTARLVAALYANFDRFDLFKQLSLLYFSAAHYSETARRSGKSELADSFLLSSDAAFSAQLRSICDAALQPTAQLEDRIRATINPFDLIGLSDPSRGPWYPALDPEMRLTSDAQKTVSAPPRRVAAAASQ